MSAKVVKATVFLTGAEIVRSMALAPLPGKNTAVFAGLPENLAPESVTAEVAGNLQILNVSSRRAYLEAPEADQAIAELQAQLDACADGLAKNLSRQEVLQAESDFLRDNSKIGGEDGISLEILRQVASYYRERLAEISEARFAAQKEQEKLEEEKERLTRQLGSARNLGKRSSSEIVVEFFAAGEMEEARVSVTYYVPAAGWKPIYEIWVQDTAGPAQLIGKAVVYQQTGEDWRDIPLTLSSGSPSLGGREPRLVPWYLDLGRPPAPRPARLAKMAAPMQMPAEAAMMDMEEAIAYAPPPLAKAEARQAQASIEFALPGLVSVPALADGSQLEILRHELPAVYLHRAVPKLDKDAFLLARVSGWEALSLLEGEVGIFLGNTYVGSTYLDPRQAGDELEISLGRDPGVIVKREKGRDMAGRSLMGTNRKASREWLLSVRNTRHSAIEIEILDQVPVPVNKAIEVDVLETSGASHDKESGELKWKFGLEAGAFKEMTLKYQVSYPGKENVALE